MATLRIPLACLAVLALSAGAASAQPARIDISPRLPTTLDPIEVTVSGFAQCLGAEIDPPQIEAGRIVIPVVDVAGPICLPAPYSESVSIGALPAGTWILEAKSNGLTAARRTIEVTPASHDLFLHGDQFRVRVDWSTSDGVLRGSAYGVPLSDDAGILWFFEGKNPEIMIKILDGRPVNGHWWVFISSNTSLEFKVSVGQRSPSNPPVYQEKVYVSPAGANKNFIDTTSFQEN
jgi:hypothetical protein